MWIILAFAVAGAMAQFVDGTLGMGFGVTSATLLLAFGVSPAAASAATHAAKIPTTLISGTAHWRHGNVDVKTFVRLAVPGALMAFIGAVILVSLSLATAKAWMAGLLLFFGALIFLRFGFGISLIRPPARGHTARWLVPIGAVGGFIDATGGGGWGPVVTPSLMTVTKHEPRTVVGSVSASEFVVAVAASAGFLTGAEKFEIPWIPVLGLVLGGMMVAPFAARLAGRLPQAPMGAMVGGLILIVNAVVIVDAVGGVPPLLGWTLLVSAIVGTGAVSWRVWRREHSEPRAIDEDGRPIDDSDYPLSAPPMRP